MESRAPLERVFPLDELVRLTYLSEIPEARLEKKRSLLAQLENAERNFKDKMKARSSFERAFMKMFKMQVELKQADFEKLGSKFQVRFLCFFFSNFMDKILVLHYFRDFWPADKIYQEFKTVQTK